MKKVLHFSSLQEAASYTPVLLISKNPFPNRKVYNCLKYFIQLFLGRTLARMQRNCMKSADNFCYVGGEVSFSSQNCVVSPIIRKAFHRYFGCQTGDLDKGWAQYICCSACAANL
jgi:hypothetical protein